MTRPVSASRTAAGRPSASIPRFTPRRRSYPSRTRNLQRQHRLALGGNTRSQKTLTQLNFVLPHNYSDNEDESLQLMEEEAARDDRVEDIPRTREMMVNHNKKRKRQQANSDRHNRTLTQMVNVDWSLRRLDAKWPGGSNARRSRKRHGIEMKTIPEAENAVGEDGSPKPSADNLQNQSEARLGVRVERSNLACGTSAQIDSENGQMLPPPNPITPQKRTRWVIPSSQSPESPEITLISPRTSKSIRNSPVRWPLASPTALLSPSPIKHRRSLLRFDANDYDSQIVPEDGFLGNDAAPGSPTSVLSSPRAISDPSISFKEDINSRFNAARAERQTRDLQKSEPKEQESIIYETDGEPDPEPLDDEAARLPEINGMRKSENSGDDQDTLHPLPETNDDQSSQILPASTYLSEMSLYYTRQPMSYAFEKFHPLQYLSTDTKDIPESAQSTEINESSQLNPLSTFYSDNQEIPPKLVPHDDSEDNYSIPQNNTVPDNGQSRSSPVVQVASSQRSEVEVPSSQTLDAESESRRIITCSQLLTESLMESIPGPPAWVSGSHSNDLNDLNDHGLERP